MGKVYLGIDPGTHCGWAVLNEIDERVDSGVWNFTPKKGEGKGVRFKRLEEEFILLLNRCNSVDIYLGIEDVKRHLGTIAGQVYGGLVAIISKVCEQRKVTYFWLNVSSIKKTATGKGNATKSEMIEAAERQWGGQYKEDEADALWIALTMKKGIF